MANQDLTPGNSASFEQDDADLTTHGSDRGRLSLSAVNSADRFVNALSPWIRESLTGEQTSRTQGSLIRRLMQKRRGDSFTFNGTVGIMRRFQRIVNRSVVWQANVGSIDPNLFDRFSTEMTRRRDIGANNIGELLKINRQEDPLEMPLAGAPESSRPAQEQQPSEPARQLTFEEIKQRIEAARNFRSQSPSGQPDFVEAMRKQAEAQAPTSPTPPAQSAPSPFPSAPTPQQPPVPPTPTSNDQPNPAAMSPRLRRRMGRKVEYISMPKMDEESGDADGEPGLSTYLALAPPGFSEPDPLPQGFFDNPSDDVLIQRGVETPAQRRRASVGAASTPLLTSQQPRRTAALSPTPTAVRYRRPERLRRPASIIARSMQHLAQSRSGSLLASRPQSLLSHIAGVPGEKRTISYLDTDRAGAVPFVPISPSLDPGNPSPINPSPINARREQFNAYPFTVDDLPLAQRRLSISQDQPDLVALQTQPLHRLPIVSLRRAASLPSTTTSSQGTATVSPPPRRIDAATPSTPPGGARLSASRPMSPPREDSPVAQQQVDRPVAQPESSFAGAKLLVDVLRQDNDALRAPMAVSDLPLTDLTLTDLPIAPPTLLQTERVLVRRSAMTPTSQLWRPSLLADSFDSLSVEGVSPLRRMAFSRATLIRQGGATRPRLATPPNSGAAPSLPVLTTSDAPASPVALRPAASWMPLAYTAQHLLQTQAQPSVEEDANIAAEAIAPLRPQSAGPAPLRRPVPAALAQQPANRNALTNTKPSPALQPSVTLLERIVQRDFAQRRATTLEEGALRILPTPSVAAPSTAQIDAATSRTPELVRPSVPSLSTVTVTDTTALNTATARTASSASSMPQRTSAVIPHAPSIRRTSLLSQTLRQLASASLPLQESTSSAQATAQQRQQRLQRSGARLRPPQPRQAQPHATLPHDRVPISLQPGQLAHTSELFGGARRSAQQPLSSANLWRRTQTSAPTLVDGATMSPGYRSFEQYAALNVASPSAQFDAPTATPLSLLAQHDMTSTSALPESSRDDGAQPAGSSFQVSSLQPRATFTPIDLPLRQLTRVFAPAKESAPVQPVQFAREDAPAVQRRISQLPRMPRPVPTKLLPPSSVQRLWETPTALPSSSSSLSARPRFQPHRTTVRSSTAPADVSPIQRLSSVDSNVDYTAIPDTPPTMRRVIAPSNVSRPDDMDTAALLAPLPQPVASSPAALGDLPATAPEPPLVEQILARDFGGLRRRELGVTSYQPVIPPVTSPSTERGRLPSVVSIAETVQRFPVRRVQSPRTRREWTRQLRRDLMPPALGSAAATDSASTITGRLPAGKPIHSMPIQRRYWSAPPVSAAWPEVWNDSANDSDTGNHLWSNLVQRSMAKADAIARSQNDTFDAMPQAPFARFPWLRRTDGPEPEIIPAPNNDIPRRSPTVTALQQEPTQTPFLPTVAGNPIAERQPGLGSSTGATTTLPMLETPNALQRTSGLNPVDVSADANVALNIASTKEALPMPSSVMPLRRLRAIPAAVTEADLPSATPSSAATRHRGAASGSPRSLVEDVVRRSFADGRRRVLAFGPLNVSQPPQLSIPVHSSTSTQPVGSTQSVGSAPSRVRQSDSASAVQRLLSTSVPSPAQQTEFPDFMDVPGVTPLASTTQAGILPSLPLRQPAKATVTAPDDRPASDVLLSSLPVGSRGRRMSNVLLDLVDRPADVIGLPKEMGRVKTTPALLGGDGVEVASRHSSVPLRAGDVARRTVTLAAARRKQSHVEPVSEIWRTALLRDAVPSAAMPQSFLADDQPVLTATPADGGRRLNEGVLQRTTVPQPGRILGMPASLLSPQAITRVEPLELALNRLLERPTREATASLLPPEQVLQRMEDGGWRFKRSGAPTSARPEDSTRDLARLQRPAPKRPIPVAPRTLLERVLQRDFAGVRVQMASLGALGVEAATQGNTVYLPPTAARLDSADALALLSHELTHVAARLPVTVQRVGLDLQPDLPVDLPLSAPSLTRQLSQRLVQMSLRDEESTAEAVESTVRRAARRRSGAALRARPQAAAQLAQRTVDGHRFAPVSSLWHGDGAPLLPPESALPATTNPFRADVTSAGDVLETMQAQGWRFKRSRPGASGAAGGADVQRAVDVAQSLSARRGEMPLPVQPRSLLERVLQRDFSGVRMQVAGLEPLGVEAAARGNTVYLQRETAANLSAPQNLALLGHELTHVAAAGHAPVQRQSISPSLSSAPDLATPLVQRSILPDLPSSRGSVAVEERTADQVEAGIQRIQRVQRTAAATPMSNSSVALPLSPLPQRTRPANGTMGVPSSLFHSPLQPASPSPLSLSAAPSAVQRTVVNDPVSRREDVPSVLNGVMQTSMPVAQRYHVPVKRNGASGEGAEGDGSDNTSTSAPMAPMGEKITITAPRVQRDPNDFDETGNVDSEPDWDRLAEKILPLLRDRLLSERDRLGW